MFLQLKVWKSWLIACKIESVDLGVVTALCNNKNAQSESAGRLLKVYTRALLWKNQTPLFNLFRLELYMHS